MIVGVAFQGKRPGVPHTVAILLNNHILARPVVFLRPPGSLVDRRVGLYGSVVRLV